jgi:hypothetical protein
VAQQARDRFTRQLLMWGIGLITVVIVLGAIGGTTVFVIALLVAVFGGLFVARAAMQEAGKVEMYCPLGITGVPEPSPGAALMEVMPGSPAFLPGDLSICRLTTPRRLSVMPPGGQSWRTLPGTNEARRTG